MNTIIFVGEHTKTYTVQTHCHDHWEIIYCTGGVGEVGFANGSTLAYRAGEIVAIPPGEMHMNNSEVGFTNIHMTVADAAFPQRTAFRLSDDAEHHLRMFFSEAKFYFDSDIARKELILGALGELIVSYLIVFCSRAPYSELVEQIRNDILKNYSDPDYRIEQFIRSIPFNYDYLRKLFKKEVGMTPLEYMTGMRMKKAETLLLAMREHEYSIAEVAEMCGFDDPLYFSRVFKKFFGTSPSTYSSGRGAG